MKALIRKYPINAVAEENNEVWLYPWRNGDEEGRPYTLEGYRYALCTSVPDSAPEERADPRMDVANYTVTEHTREEQDGIDEDGRPIAHIVKYWTAEYTGGN